MGSKEELFIIGRVISPHGVRGEVRVYPLTDFPERFMETHQVYLCKDGVELRQVEKARFHKNLILLKLQGCDTADDAEELRGAELKVSEEDLVKLPPGAYYVHQLRGLQVYTLQGTWVGTLVEVIKTGANDVYVVSPDGDLLMDPNSPEAILIPALKIIVKKIELGDGKMLIDPIPGLVKE